MTPFAQQVIQDVAAKWGINPELIAGKCRRKRVVCARIDAAKRMKAAGYTATKIGKQLGCDHTTVLFYLGRRKGRKPPQPDWHAPEVRHVRWLKVPGGLRAPDKVERYLVPYAGADWTEYRWKERPSRDASDERHRQAGDRAADRRPASERAAPAQLRVDHDQAA
jgi:hypothetical protein